MLRKTSCPKRVTLSNSLVGVPSMWRCHGKDLLRWYKFQLNFIKKTFFWQLTSFEGWRQEIFSNQIFAILANFPWLFVWVYLQDYNADFDGYNENGCVNLVFPFFPSTNISANPARWEQLRYPQNPRSLQKWRLTAINKSVLTIQ